MAKKVFTDESLQTFVDEIKAGLDSKSSTSHTHKYAGSSSAGGSANSANKVNSSLTVKLNGGTTEGTNLFTFNGSSAKSVNITPSSIGAATSSHTHDDRYYTETEVDTKLSGKANTSHGNHVPATQTASNKVFLRNDNTWATVTPANIGAAASSHTHKVANISDLTATATELNYMDGVTSNVQTQLDGKAASSHTHKYAGSSSAGGSANSAVKLATARTIGLSGDITGSVSFDGSANATITAKRRRCTVGQSSNTITNPYYKFASIKLTDAYTDAEIVFKVSTGYALNSASGILRAHFRVGNGIKKETAEIYWEYANSDIDNSKFVMAYSNDASPTIELWVKIDSTYMHYQFDVLQEHNRTTHTNSWTLYNTSSAGSASAITSGYTQITSSFLTIKNSISGSAVSATKATQDASGNTITSTYATKSELNTAKSNLQASIDAKQVTITGGASTITGSNLTANRALISNGSGKVAVSAVTSTELGYLDGVTSSVQTQLNDKAPIANGQYAVTTSGTGAAYTATVPSIKSLTAGVSFIMIPNTVSTTTAPTLNVNSLGAKSIKRRLSNLPTSLQNGYSNAWLAQGKPFRVVYDGTAWIVEGHEKPSAADLYGLTATITELNYCDGVTSSIQTQLNALSSRIAALETILANDVLAINV